MFSTIESKFKKLSLYHKNIKLLFILLILYFIFGCSVLHTKKIWLFITFVILLCLITYLYVISENIKMKVISKNNWKKIFNLTYTLNAFFDNQRDKDKELLKKILKEEKINTRAKVKNIIEHYRAYIPRSIIGGGTFLSILAIFISIGSFIYDQNTHIINEKVQIIIYLMIFVTLGWVIFSFVAKYIGTLFSKKSFYLRMEDLLTEIYINNEIK